MRMDLATSAPVLARELHPPRAELEQEFEAESDGVSDKPLARAPSRARSRSSRRHKQYSVVRLKAGLHARVLTARSDVCSIAQRFNGVRTR